jgi:hypothetical protein
MTFILDSSFKENNNITVMIRAIMDMHKPTLVAIKSGRLVLIAPVGLINRAKLVKWKHSQTV